MAEPEVDARWSMGFGKTVATDETAKGLAVVVVVAGG
jgi:hypothetical protein